jgi:subtilisin family serine protease
MKKIYILIASLLIGVAGYAQNENWHHLAPEDGVFGAAIERAHAAARESGLRPARRPITIALIGGGIDISHKAISDIIWVNRRERRINGRDNDRNGWIDDRHGWNFLGNDTMTINSLSTMGDREFLRLKDKYNHFLFVEDGIAYMFDDELGALVETEPPADMEEFEYFLRVVTESELAETNRGVMLAKAVVWYIREIGHSMRMAYPERVLTRTDFGEFVRAQQSTTAMQDALFAFIDLMFMSANTEDWNTMAAFADTEFIPIQELRHERAMARRFPRERELIGDDPNDLNDKGYGNNNLLANNALRNTMIAGIIGAGGGQSEIRGITNNVQIMTLRIEADFGEPYMKDMALAIRYAVEQGADIIQLGATNRLFPRHQSHWVEEALRYAEQRNVLVVIPVRDLSSNLDDFPFYPNRNLSTGTLSNIITVAASDSLGNPFLWANFSETELDIFAPGVEIKSAMPGNRYAIDSGSAYAAAMVTGVAAFIKNYFPQITPAQMRQLLIDTVTDRSDAEVEKQYRATAGSMRGRIATDLFLFSDLCVSGGILNAERAIKEAGRRF